ncbi:uncharacterized protein LTR77_009815 [Saxophila tyrrhenica]|uniref:Uncharacterized protein n=1 Tax=Saxophila tyrrhenica TaxID=1690608 RepID=A0AAV9NXC9_9PEZI|nr:hypothetical protein LTR77_009815 [Saxophila tyrrhenica]
MAKASTIPNTAAGPETEQQSPLLNLPPELRNVVYEYVFHGNGPANFDAATVVAHKQLLNTWTEIRNEASTILYGKHSFTIDADQPMQALRTFCQLNYLGPLSNHECLIVRFEIDLTGLEGLTARQVAAALYHRCRALFKGISDLALLLCGQRVRAEAVASEQVLTGPSAPGAKRLLNRIVNGFYRRLRSYQVGRRKQGSVIRQSQALPTHVQPLEKQKALLFERRKRQEAGHVVCH